jgi:hypothetical protein
VEVALARLLWTLKLNDGNTNLQTATPIQQQTKQCSASLEKREPEVQIAKFAQQPMLDGRSGEVASSALGVRREKAALFQWVQIPPGNRSSRK